MQKRVALHIELSLFCLQASEEEEDDCQTGEMPETMEADSFPDVLDKGRRIANLEAEQEQPKHNCAA